MPEPDDRPKRRWLGGGWKRWLLAGVGVVVVVVVAAVIFVLVHEPHNVSHPNLSFTVPTHTTTSSTTTKTTSAAKPDNFTWPIYGYSLGRDRAFTGESNLHPPFRRGWQLPAGALLEFPPVIHGHTLWFLNDSGTVKAVDTLTGKLEWQKSEGSLSSASPGLDVGAGILIVPIMAEHGTTPGNGQIVAMSMKTGKVIWHRAIASGSESSPLIYRNTVFYGDSAGTVYSANVKTGHINWSFQASGAVKGGAALSGNDLYVDDYGGHVYDINARNGHKIWSASAAGGDLGFSSGTFYSTPTVAFGRVYVGNTSGYIYSFAASTGQLAWSYGTGAYVYSSAAVADVPGLGPTVYMGSYNGDFYAFNAQSGAVRWVHHDAKGDRISGSATVLNGVVYYSDLDDKLTTGLNARTGKPEFSFTDGAFSPVVADEDHIYLSGGYTLYELNPKDGLPKSKSTANTTLKHGTKLTAAERRRLAARKRAAERRKLLLARRRAAAKRAAEKRAAEKRAAERRAAARRKKK